jgi:hypothetical protein
VPATLSETAYYTRRGVKIAAIGLSVYLVLTIFWRLIKPLIFKPPPPEPPGQELGLIPALEFPDQPGLPQLEYALQTPEGDQPPTDFPDRLKVFTLRVPQPEYLDLEQSTDIADKLGFKNPPQMVSPTLYRWRRTDKFPGSLVMNIVTQSLDLVNDWQTDQQLLENRRALDPGKLLSDLVRYLQNGHLYNEDFKNGHQEYLYYQYLEGQLIPVPSQSQADLIQVNFFRQDVNELPVVQLDSQHPLVWALVTSAQDYNKFIAEVHYRYQEIGEKSGDYPILTGDVAWQQFTEGKGYVVNLGSNQGQVIIRDISLAYYEPREPEAYLHPVYVFKGDNDFLGFLPALKYSEIK